MFPLRVRLSVVPIATMSVPPVIELTCTERDMVVTFEKYRSVMTDPVVSNIA